MCVAFTATPDGESNSPVAVPFVPNWSSNLPDKSDITKRLLLVSAMNRFVMFEANPFGEVKF